MDRFDPRIIRVGVEVDGEVRVYEDLDITVSGTKVANPTQNTCMVRLANLKRSVRNYLLTETSPFNGKRTPKRLWVEVGRLSQSAPVTSPVVTPPQRNPAGLVEPGNIDLNNRPVVRNADGTISTVRSISIEEDGRTVLIPTVSDDGRILSDDAAVAQYQRTGKQLGIFSSEKAATDYAFSLHTAQAVQYGDRPAPRSQLTRIFTGEIVTSAPSQPPDIGLTLTAKTGAFAQGQVVSRSGAAQQALSSLAGRIAADLGLTLDFRAQDKQIANYAFNGPKLRQVQALELAGGVDAFVDDETLVVKDRGAPLVDRTHVLSAQSGMIGVPEATERGVKVQMMLDAKVTLGGGLTIDSALNPAMNGAYTIYKLDFDAATRDQPFYWTAEASRNGYTPPASEAAG